MVSINQQLSIIKIQLSLGQSNPLLFVIMAIQFSCIYLFTSLKFWICFK